LGERGADIGGPGTSPALRAPQICLSPRPKVGSPLSHASGESAAGGRVAGSVVFRAFCLRTCNWNLASRGHAKSTLDLTHAAHRKTHGAHELTQVTQQPTQCTDPLTLMNGQVLSGQVLNGQRKVKLAKLGCVPGAASFFLQRGTSKFSAFPRSETRSRRPAASAGSMKLAVMRDDRQLGACRSMPIARSKPPVPPNTSLLFGHNATALLPHRASYRRNIRLRIGQRAYPDRLLAPAVSLRGARGSPLHERPNETVRKNETTSERHQRLGLL
jgi:hypothetical protein